MKDSYYILIAISIAVSLYKVLSRKVVTIYVSQQAVRAHLTIFLQAVTILVS